MICRGSFQPQLLIFKISSAVPQEGSKFSLKNQQKSACGPKGAAGYRWAAPRSLAPQRVQTSVNKLCSCRDQVYLGPQSPKFHLPEPREAHGHSSASAQARLGMACRQSFSQNCYGAQAHLGMATGHGKG